MSMKKLLGRIIMKKRLLPVLLLVLALVFTGCSTTQVEFWNKCQESSKWEASTIKAKMAMDMTVADETMKMTMDMDGHANTADMSSELTMNMNATATGQVIKVNDAKIIMKDDKTYISKNYLAQCFAVDGMTVPEILTNADTDFITFTDSNEQTAMMMALVKQSMLEDPAKYYEMMKDVAADLGFDVAVTKKDNTYTIELNEKEVLALVKQIILTTTENIESLNTKYKLNIPADKIAELKGQMDEVKVQLDQLIPMAEAMVKGTFKMDYTFGKDVVNQKLVMNFAIPMLNMTMNMSMDADTAKAEVKEIKAPEKVLEMTQTELMEAMMPKMAIINTNTNIIMDGMGKEETCKVLVKADKVYVPAKLTLGYLGQEVKYDEVAKKAGIEVNGTFVALNTITDNSTSYISVEELQKLGYTVEKAVGSIAIY